jgi:crossover junction endodeoxyribonuclease RuvC
MLKRVLGIDPGLARTGWGIIEAEGNRLSFVAGGTITSNAKHEMAERLRTLYVGLQEVISTYQPTHVGVEEVFVNDNAKTSLLLGQARGLALLVPALAGLEVAEYTPLLVKKSVVGYGRAEKEQVAHMVKVLLPTAQLVGADMADALAVAICHSHHLFSPGIRLTK